ncbi:MAG: hypothetical protein H8E44_22245 [Planctomycetes bacterium]|nr:hypothetical protein [Planctomycetota bacterium]MBL7043109.1 hypothetical protein [Pirellulaceae bacterium]
MTSVRIWAICTFVVFLSVTASAQPPAEENNGNKADDTAIREQTIYVPYSKLQEVFEEQGRGVFLPYEQFQKLWKQARASLPTEPDEKPPVAALVTEIESVATVGEEVVKVEAKLKLEVLTEGWHEVPLRLADAAILSAKLGDQPARIVSKPQVGYTLLVKKEGEQPEELELALEYTKAFSKSPGQNSVSFQAPQAPVNRWEIHIPESGVKVEVHPMIAATEAPGEGADDEAAGETVVLAFVGAAPSMRIDWTPKAEGAAGLEALASVQADQQVTIDEGVVRTKTQLTYKISRAELSQMSVETPSDHRVLNVFDPNVKEWTVAQDENVNKITVQLYEPAREAQTITVELEKFSDDLLDGPVPVPVVKSLGVGRQQGVVLVRVTPALRAEPVTRNGLLQMDAAKGWNFSYRYASLPFDLSFSVEKVEPQIRTRELIEAYFEPERLTVDLFVLYDIKRAGVFQLELDVPQGFEVEDVRGHAAAGATAVARDTYHLQGDDKTRLVVNLSSKAEGKVGLLVELTQRLEDPNLLTPTGNASDIALPLPRVAPQGVEQSTGRLIVYGPESLRVNPTTQDGVQAISVAEALEDTATTRDGRFGEAREVMAFAYTREPVDLVMAVERRKPYITARQFLLARIESGVVKYEATFFYDIRYSSVKSLRLDVPAELAGQIHNDTTAVARDATLEPQPDDVADGYVAWSLTGDTELFGRVTMKFSWEKKIKQLEIGGTMDEPERLPRLVPKAVDRGEGQIVIAKAETLDVRVSGDAVGLRPIDPQHDLMSDVAKVEDAARAFEFHDDWELAITATRYELIEVKRTSIERAVVRMEVTRSGEISVQALYRMRSALQRLDIVLPKDVDFDTSPLSINGRSFSLERGDQGKNEFYIPLASQNSEDPFLIELRYTMKGDHRRLDLPEFPSKPAVQKVYLCAYIPRELALLGATGPWTDEMEWRWYEALGSRPYPHRDDSELIEWVVEDLPLDNPPEEFVTDGRLYTFSTLAPGAPPKGSLRLVAAKEIVLHGSVFAVVVILGLLLIFQPLSHKFAAVALLVALLLAAGVFLPTFSRQIMDGALFSAVAIVAAVWLIWHVIKAWPHVIAALSRRRPAAASSTSEEPPAEATAEPESPAESPPSPEAEDAPEGESPFGGESEEEGDTESKKSEEATGGEPADDQQKGGRDDA